MSDAFVDSIERFLVDTDTRTKESRLRPAYLTVLRSFDFAFVMSLFALPQQERMRASVIGIRFVRMAIALTKVAADLDCRLNIARDELSGSLREEAIAFYVSKALRAVESFPAYFACLQSWLSRCNLPRVTRPARMLTEHCVGELSCQLGAVIAAEPTETWARFGHAFGKVERRRLDIVERLGDVLVAPDGAERERRKLQGLQASLVFLVRLGLDRSPTEAARNFVLVHASEAAGYALTSSAVTSRRDRAHSRPS